MHLVYSAFRITPPAATITARQKGYLAACKKHSDTIAAIHRYLPGWMPEAPANNSCTRPLTVNKAKFKLDITKEQLIINQFNHSVNQ